MAVTVMAVMVMAVMVMVTGMVVMRTGVVDTGAVMDGAVGGDQASASLSPPAITDAAAGIRTMAIIPAATAGATSHRRTEVRLVRYGYSPLSCRVMPPILRPPLPPALGLGQRASSSDPLGAPLVADVADVAVAAGGMG
jgi:hypothetical protein